MRNWLRQHPIIVVTIVLIALILVSLTIGRYPVTLTEIYQVFTAKIAGKELTFKQEEIFFLLTEIRMPRIIAAVLVGAALTSSGAVYQSMFVNPLVSPDILGVLAGASFGAAIGIVVFQSWAATQILAFAFACLAVGIAVLLATLFPRLGLLVLVLGGMISMAFFRALTNLMQYIADPTNQLPQIVYWTMGTFANATNPMLVRTAPLIIICVIIMCVHGKIINVMSLGDEEALGLGINVKRKRLQMIAIATLASASTVAIAGTIQWVGLVIPHVVRFFIGPDNRTLLPVVAITGSVYLLFMDDLVRSVFSVEVPIGIVTAIMCLPIFVWALYKEKAKWR